MRKIVIGTGLLAGAALIVPALAQVGENGDVTAQADMSSSVSSVMADDDFQGIFDSFTGTGANADSSVSDMSSSSSVSSVAGADRSDDTGGFLYEEEDMTPEGLPETGRGGMAR
ncbi:MAG: hypothetical protein PHW10_02195 [Candidatus Peribacteraceae bacterium]|nr:hypothetical protein [Candidatus Peribacteraceae bacterium]